MKLGSAGIVVLGMSGSFILVLVVMVLMLRPGQRSTAPQSRGNAVEQAPKQPRPPASDKIAETTPAEVAAKDRSAPKDVSVNEPLQAAEPVRQNTRPPLTEAQRVAQLPVPEQTAYWKLQQERKEVQMLREEMQERLKEKERLRGVKIARLAENCEKLKIEEAAQILLALDNDTVRDVLRKMARGKAVPVAALLGELGRKDALSYINGS